MGATWVALTVESANVDTVTKIAKAKSFNDEACDDHADGLTSLLYTCVSRGELGFLDELEAEGIAYSVNWGAGIEFSAGERHFRNEGGVDYACEFYAKTALVGFTMEDLKKAASKGIGAVNALFDGVESEHHVPDWPNGTKTELATVVSA